MPASISPERYLAQFVSTASPDGWTPETRDLSVEAISDAFCVGVAGMTESSVQRAKTSVVPVDGEGTCQLWDAPTRYAWGDAAFIGGVACHALDWDDYMHPMHGHCSTVLLPVVWALTDGLQLGGSELIDAFAVGYHVDYLASQLFAEAHYARGWHATSTVGTLGATAAAARLLRLSEDDCLAAMAIASSLAGGLRANFGSDTKAIHAGMAARHGVQAALLAASGIGASDDWLISRNGMLRVFGAETVDPKSSALQDADTTHGIETSRGLIQKPYACCGSCHAALEAAISIQEEFDFEGSEIDKIEVHLDPLVPSIMTENAPSSPRTARYCLPWAVAVAVSDRKAGPDQFSETAIARDDVIRLSEKVQVIADLQTGDDDRFASRVVIRAQDEAYSRAVTYAQGHPARPMSAAQRESKKRDALSAVVTGQHAQDLIGLLAQLERLENLMPIHESLSLRTAHQASDAVEVSRGD